VPPRTSSALALTLAAACSLGAQAPHGEHPPETLAAPRSSAHLGAQGIGVVTHASPAFAGRSFTEGYFSQPVVMGEVAPGSGRLRLTGTLNLEGLTLRRGELNGGIYGEGYVDRRHPHTLVHEAMAAFGGPALGARASIAAGKGFVGFGTDDPMMRPFVKFPVNHHLAQILERYVVVGAVRAGRALVEATTFNGDEPSGPYAWPSVRRFGDSWAVRGTVVPFTAGRAARRAGVQLSASVARLESPENAFGGGLDQRKSSLALRYTHGAALGAAGVGDRRPPKPPCAGGASSSRRAPSAPTGPRRSGCSIPSARCGRTSRTRSSASRAGACSPWARAASSPRAARCRCAWRRSWSSPT
jgi:hypothetical protein